MPVHRPNNVNTRGGKRLVKHSPTTCEQWLFKNKKAADLVKSALRDAKKGRLMKAREDFSKYIDQSR